MPPISKPPIGLSDAEIVATVSVSTVLGSGVVTELVLTSSGDTVFDVADD